ncbi:MULTISPECIES: hypothetical protein [Pseudomonas]|uniref:RNA polymerase sigma-70 region 2 domain-containing protein n=1 Tax=Pseudomonas fluorescens (strain Pf0-1) TaxID=205922 RepID=Q3KDZ9_PSEPF|nr:MULTISPECIES: hypothetical protein [Pseudomonas]ABA74007.1 hypothetical protein Pfl01_2264 [Pseudomonas fluorescens Pf0-1]MBL0798612.1 hypothetical protein [Pseudomonas sp. B7]MBY9026803.1 hypothetical protein [Pseudomonas fluorescens]MBY9032413.1 hypothetical protein [Pseudomonas fluorescens]MBY9038823.1 hypothetical protein [Pseudomonas fluorescens]
MAEGYRHTCLCESDRLGNDELYALVAGAVRHGRSEAQQLFATVTPLLIAFYEGQVQAGRIRREDTGGLVQQAFRTLYQEQAAHDPSFPFRAWLIEIARATLLNNLDHRGTDAVADALAGASARECHEPTRAT